MSKACIKPWINTHHTESNMEKKVGDRIFFEYCDGTIGTAVIKEIEPKVYHETDGKEVKYNRYRTSHYEFTEDYSCLPDDDPRVVEYCNGKTFHVITVLREQVLQLLKDNGCKKGDPGISEMLYELSNEFESK